MIIIYVGFKLTYTVECLDFDMTQTRTWTTNIYYHLSLITSNIKNLSFAFLGWKWVQFFSRYFGGKTYKL